MKFITAGILTAFLTGCGTVGGTLQGAGEDLKKAGDWIKTR